MARRPYTQKDLDESYTFNEPGNYQAPRPLPVSEAVTTYVPYTGANSDVDLGTHNLTTDAVQFNLSPTITPSDGLAYWDATDKTLATTIDATAGVTLQHGQEIHIRCVNKSGADIPNGKVVYVDDAQGNRPTIRLAQADDFDTSCVIGVTTQDITDNLEGFVTAFGIVRGINTSGFTDGDMLYLDPANAGGIVNVAPSSPNFCVYVGQALNSTVNGSIFVRPETPLALDVTLGGDLDCAAPSQKAVKDHIDYRLEFLTDCLNPTGFTDSDNITRSYSVANRTVTLTGDLTYYWRGVKHELTSPWTSSAHNSADGVYFLQSTDGENFTWSAGTFDYANVMVAIGIKSTSPAYAFGLAECHGTMDVDSHHELHDRIGTYLVSGGALTPGTYAENTATDAANSPGFDAATIKDEDLQTVLPIWAEGTYTTMRIGASAAVTFDTTATLPFRSSGSYILVNNPATGAETAAGNNQYLNVYQILIPVTGDTDSQKYRMVLLQPQAAYTSLTSAQAEDPRALSLGNLSSLAPEYVIHARITYITSAGDGNTGKCRIATGGVTYITGSRTSQVSVGGYVPSSHLNLTDLQGGTAGEYYHLTSAQFTFISNASTVGWAFLNLTNPSAIRFPRINADNTVSALSDSDFRTAIGSLVLGETSSTAYRGDRGKTAYDHSQLTSGTPHGGAYLVPQKNLSPVSLDVVNEVTGYAHDWGVGGSSNSQWGVTIFRMETVAGQSNIGQLNGALSALYHSQPFDVPYWAGIETGAMFIDGASASVSVGYGLRFKYPTLANGATVGEFSPIYIPFDNANGAGVATSWAIYSNSQWPTRLNGELWFSCTDGNHARIRTSSNVLVLQGGTSGIAFRGLNNELIASYYAGINRVSGLGYRGNTASSGLTNGAIIFNASSYESSTFRRWAIANNQTTNGALGFYVSDSATTDPDLTTPGTPAVLLKSDKTAEFTADVKCATAGKGFYVKEGSNAKMGTATLSAGAATVSTTAVAATSRVFLTVQSLGTVTAPKSVAVTGRTAGTSFTIMSEDNTDTSVVAWIIFDPA